MSRSIVGAILLAGALAVGCSRAGFHSHAAPVILISIDTLRADHLPAYGYTQVKTPALDDLRRDAILYENAFSHVPLTLPSHTTMMTGLLPPQNAVRDNVGYVLSASHPTLATVLKKQGYATGAAISAVVLASSTGINQGFDDYEDGVEAKAETATLSQVQRSGFETEKIAEKWIAAHESRPFFFFLHLYEPHTPYTPAAPFDKIYADRPYDGEIATADEIVGELVAFLRREKLYSDSLIILVSDHGEGLGDHGEAEHGILLYRETLHVPLLIKLPNAWRAGSTVSKPAGLEDLFPTIASIVGVVPPAGLPGRVLPFDPRDAGQFPVRDIYSETLYPRYHLGWSDLASLTDDQFEYIHAPNEEIYDYRTDPAEVRNLASGLPAPFRRMRNALLSMDRPRQAPGRGDPEQVKKLAALGYLGSASPPEDAENLPNPVEHMDELNRLHQAIRLYAQKQYREAIPILNQLLKDDSGMTDAWIQLANNFHKLGRTEDSLAALQKADQWKPGDPVTLASMANEYYDLGNMEQARLYAQRSIAVNGPAEAREVLASVLLHEHNLEGAEKEAQVALETGHMGHVKPEMILAQVEKARGNLSGALARLLRVEEKLEDREERQVSNLHYFIGDLLARLGRNDDAEKEFREEMRFFPGNPPGWTALAILQASQGRGEDARRTLLEMTRESPTPRCMRAAAETFRILGDSASAALWQQKARSAAIEPPRSSGPRS